MAVLGRRLGRETNGQSSTAEEAPTTDCVLLGCHGGAGTSTLAALLGTQWDLGSYESETLRIETFGRPLLLVTRDSAPASARAVEAVTGVSGSGTTVAGLVVVADGSGPEPREATVRLRLVEDRVERVVRFPFVAGLRYADIADAGRVGLPKKAERALAEIRRLCGTVDSPESDTKEQEKRI
ncbi:hypothetical protein [Actinorugispora endophytica]|uniref:Uncharacterized protein n=1 Tax=Actinorugispora endophytica TaxID=1605990 RepID=A0A4R6V7D6_9ACTN|nr:hypothetical protein [Actinorugispora endophytica]TDQ55009.1 hypothetical protein EV190_101330 [Actinorugispora endophytica]